MSIYMLVDRPHIITPRAEKNRAVWLALFRPKRLHRRPYSGVKLHVARRYLVCTVSGSSVVYEEGVPGTHDVPSQLAWLDLLNSEEMEGSTNDDEWFQDIKEQDQGDRTHW